jgi:hypothetical protein
MMKRKETAICNVDCRYFDDNLLSHCPQNKRFNLWSTASVVNIARPSHILDPKAPDSRESLRRFMGRRLESGVVDNELAGCRRCTVVSGRHWEG